MPPAALVTPGHGRTNGEADIITLVERAKGTPEPSDNKSNPTTLELATNTAAQKAEPFSRPTPEQGGQGVRRNEN